MNLTRCNSGHFYDSDKYGSCPHCASAGAATASDVTVPMMPDDSKTMPLQGIDGINEVVGTTQSLSNAQTRSQDDDQKTISFSSQSIGVEPTVGWLVIVGGKDMGTDFRLKAGRNFIGRSPSMDIALKNDKTVSREKHGIVVYDPKSYTYIVQPGTAKELCYLNDEVVLSPQVLELNDVITVGETKLLFVPLCTKDGFNWDKVD